MPKNSSKLVDLQGSSTLSPLVKSFAKSAWDLGVSLDHFSEFADKATKQLNKFSESVQVNINDSAEFITTEIKKGASFFSYLAKSESGLNLSCPPKKQLKSSFKPLPNKVFLIIYQLTMEP